MSGPREVRTRGGVSQAARIPLELCLTSNVRTESVRGYGGHHLGRFLRRGHPVALCTDDSGVFQTTLSTEFAHAARAFALRGAAPGCAARLCAEGGGAGRGVCVCAEADMVALVECAIEAAFTSGDIKAALRRRLERFRDAWEAR